MSPTQRTLAWLRERGWTAEVVERWIPGGFIRKDYLGIIDILAINEHETMGVQSCGEAFSDHLTKATVTNAKALRLWLHCGRRFLLLGWRPLKVKRGGIAKHYKPREMELFPFDLEDEKMRTPEKQYQELRKRGRTYEQIRAIAIARNDTPLLDYLQSITEDLV